MIISNALVDISIDVVKTQLQAINGNSVSLRLYSSTLTYDQWLDQDQDKFSYPYLAEITDEVHDDLAERFSINHVSADTNKLIIDLSGMNRQTVVSNGVPLSFILFLGNDSDYIASIYGTVGQDIIARGDPETNTYVYSSKIVVPFTNVFTSIQ